MNLSKYHLGFGLICIGLAIAGGVNYLDMRQFEAQIPGNTTAGWSPSDASAIYQGLKSKDGFSQKYFSPEGSAALIRDYSTMDLDLRQQFQNIRDSVTRKKSDALKFMGMFLLFGSLSLWNYSVTRKSSIEKSSLAGAIV